MRPLLQDDLLPLAEYAARRREFYQSHQQYLERRRRIRVGPSVTLIFENRQTMWYRVQETVRVARLTAADMIQRELNLCNRLLPGVNRLQASMIVELDESHLGDELARWQALRGDQVRMQLGPESIPADLLTCRPEDRCAGTAYWVQFALGPSHISILKKSAPPVCIEVAAPGYQHISKPLPAAVRASLAEDLEMSARDAA
jgi:hypothetical protein